MPRFALAFAAVATLGFASVPAFAPAFADEAQNLCGARNEIVTKLSSHYQEQPTAVGMVDKNAVLEVFVSDNGTWTIIATGTDGNSCVLSSGEGWQSTTLVAGKDA
jgi:hypothetical protein